VSTETSEIVVSGIPVQVVRKKIKNLHLATYPPDGRVRIAVPLHVDDDAVHLAVTSKLGWIRKQQRAYAEQPRESEREMVNGESHYVRGVRYRLRVAERLGKQDVKLSGGTLELGVRPGSTPEQRRALLDRWHRKRLQQDVERLVAKWEPYVGAKVSEARIKRMRTRWGTCNAQAGRIWINAELAKKPDECLEYIVVHEMVHLLERRHNDVFKRHMDRLLPHWRNSRDALNATPLGHEEWGY